MLKALPSNDDQPEEVSIPVQPVSLDIWDKKYRLKYKHGNNQEANVDETFLRIAKALADIEVKDQAQWQEKFLRYYECGFRPCLVQVSDVQGLQDF